jgi:hypothetical protein
MRVCRVASIPFSVGSPTSMKIKSGCNSLAFRIASNPSETSATIAPDEDVQAVAKFQTESGLILPVSSEEPAQNFLGRATLRDRPCCAEHGITFHWSTECQSLQTQWSSKELGMWTPMSEMERLSH